MDVDQAPEAESKAQSSAELIAASSVALPRPVANRLKRYAVLMIVVVLGLMAVGLTRSVIHGPQGPWRGDYYEGEDFEGDSTVRYTRKLEFEWGKRAPFRGMPKDKWSVVYTTCLIVKEEEEYRFRLTSDDGSRLYIDGERLIDNWGPHSPRTRSGKYVLEPGVYELMVEYYEANHGAVLKLVAAIGEGAKHETLSPSRLAQPAEDPDAPCG